MNEEDSKRNQRGNIPAGSTHQEGKSGSFFQANGLEHYSFTPRSIISWGILSGLVGLITASIVGYRSFGSQVDERISNNLELNRTLIDHDNRIKKTEEGLQETKHNIEKIVCFLSKGKDPRCK